MMLVEDLRFAVRTLRKNPGFAVAAVLALALGIGANSAMFTVIDAVLLRPLPFPHSERLVNVWETNLVRKLPTFPVAAANYYDWKKQNQVFSALGAYQAATLNLAANEGEPERYVGVVCDRGFFDVLQVTPLMGRVLTEDEEPAGKNGVLLLSYGVWKQRFGGDPNVLGQKLVVNGMPRTIIGVMPSGFSYPPQTTMWAPLGFSNEDRERRDLHRLRVIARLKDGVSLAGARSEFGALGVRLAQAYPMFNKDAGIAVNLLLEDLVGKLRPTLLILVGAVAFVLLIACANVANLLLAKASGRQREIAIRSSLGAARDRIFRQMLTESVVLAAVGGAAGIIFAYGMLRGLLALAPANLPRMQQVSLDWRAVVFTLAVSLVTGIVFGLAPAWYGSRTDLNSLLKEGARGTTGRSRLRNALIVGQVSAALILLSGAGLLLRSFYEIEHVDPGFHAEHVMTMQLAPAPNKYRGHQDLLVQLATGIGKQVASLPGVKSVAITTSIPLLGNPIFIMRFEGGPDVTPAQAPVVNYFAVTPGYFETMGMRIVRGRAISERDTASAPPAVVVNQTLVDRYFPGQDAIGKRLEIGFDTPPNWRQIVGVVADVHTAGLDQDSPVQAYVSYFQDPDSLGLGPGPITVLARTSGNPAAVGESIKSAILSIDRAQPVYAMQPMTNIVGDSVAQRRFSLVLLAFFALSALFLAAVGLYGVMSYVVMQRTSEIGIRMALGARPTQVLLLMERQGMMLVLVGLLLGLVGGLLLTRLMSSLLFHVTPDDPLALLAGALTLLVVSVAACYLPARRAAQVDPLIALRYE